MYETMRYWDEDQADWGAPERDFAAAWRRRPKWVTSRSLKSVGPNATLVEDGVEAVVRGLKGNRHGEIEVAGSELAASLTDLGLIDEHRLHLHPVVPGGGKPLFAGPRPPLRPKAGDLIGKDVIRLTYIPPNYPTRRRADRQLRSTLDRASPLPGRARCRQSPAFHPLKLHHTSVFKLSEPSSSVCIRPTKSGPTYGYARKFSLSESSSSVGNGRTRWIKAPLSPASFRIMFRANWCASFPSITAPA